MSKKLILVAVEDLVEAQMAFPSDQYVVETLSFQPADDQICFALITQNVNLKDEDTIKRLNELNTHDWTRFLTRGESSALLDILSGASWIIEIQFYMPLSSLFEATAHAPME